MLYVRKVLVVIKSGEKNKPMDQDGRGWWEERRKKSAKINREDDSPTTPLGVEIDTCPAIIDELHVSFTPSVPKYMSL